MIILHKYPGISSENGKIIFTDYSKVYEVELSLSEIESVEIRDVRVENDTIKIKIPLLPGSKMSKVGITKSLKEIEITVEEFMLPLLRKGGSESTKIFLQIIYDIQDMLKSGNPIEDIQTKLENPEDLVREALSNYLESSKFSP
eukprot:NODE_425_length_7669_cov_0.863937.p6 type:complete len:144 gc:universal NODE_425_length_7669_cov_0.863937:4657-5088(+)